MRPREFPWRKTHFIALKITPLIVQYTIELEKWAILRTMIGHSPQIGGRIFGTHGMGPLSTMSQFNNIKFNHSLSNVWKIKWIF